MLIGGLQKTTLIDYPNKLAATIFTLGCNFRCSFCHNAELVFRSAEPISEEDIFDFLKQRKNFLQAICVTGGEPTIHDDLDQLIKKIKQFGFLVKLDTNGTAPKVIEKLIKNKLIDYIAMDIKAPWSKYKQITGVDRDIEKIKKSVDLLMQNKVDYEFRSTIVKELHPREDIIQMAEQIKGAKKYYLQQFRSAEKLVNPQCRYSSYTNKELNGIINEINDNFDICELRGSDF